MANNYLEFSEIIGNLTDEEIAWWESEILRINSVQEKIENEEIEDEEAEEAEEGMCYDFDFDAPQRQVWFHPDESGNVDRVVEVVHRFLKETGRKDCFWLTWAEHCSKHRIGEFGGGAVFVTAQGIEWCSAYEWVDKKKAEFLNREKGFPCINLSFQGWCHNAEITQCYEIDSGALIDLAGVSAKELAQKINDGLWSISLRDCLGQSTKEEIEISDVEANG